MHSAPSYRKRRRRLQEGRALGSVRNGHWRGFNVSHLFLLPELRFHLLVARLVLPDAVSGDEVAADVSQLWVLFASFLDQSKKIMHILKLSVGEGNI